MKNSNCPVCKSGAAIGDWPFPQGDEEICDKHRAMLAAFREPSMQLKNPTIVMLALTVLIERAGGRVRITQKEINAVSYNRLFENTVTEPDGSAGIELEFVKRPAAS